LKNAFLVVGAGIVGIIILLVGYPALVRQRPVAPLAQAPGHGISFILEVEPAKTESATNDLGLLKAPVLKRSDQIGLKIFWELISETQVRVAVAAGSSGEGERLRRALFRPGRLEFRLVHEDSDRMIAVGELPPGYELLQHEEGRASGGRRTERVIIKKKSEAGLSGNLIKEAMVTRGSLGEPEIHFTLQPEAAAAFAKVTGDNAGRRLAIVVDGELCSAPRINEPIKTGTGMITGGFDAREALEIAGALDCPLPFAVKVVELRGY
jgi:preprotein translocase subunit SecD